MNLTTNEFYMHFEEELKKAKKSLLIVSPYIKLKAAEKLINMVKGRSLNLKLLTLPPGPEYITGATDLEAILALKREGFEIRMLSSLHAKIYLIDHEIVFLGSANFTNNGWGLSKNPNKEIMFKQVIERDYIDVILNEYWNHKRVFSLDAFRDFEAQVRELQSRYSSVQDKLKQVRTDFTDIFTPTPSPHEQLLSKLKEKGVILEYEHMKKNYYKHAFKINNKQVVKVMRSKEGVANQEKGYQTFNYQLHGTSASLFFQRQLKALILILEEPDHFVCLPTSFLIKKVLLKTYKGKNDDWQFKIKRNEKELILTVRGKRSLRRLNIKHYEGSLRFKFLK